MTELSNAVTVLIARMESHPEDFAVGGKFTGVADALYGMLGLVQDIPRSSYWFLTDADKEALTEAWKKYHRTAMDKEVMTKIFDEDYYKRQEEAKLYEQQMKQQMYQQKAAMQNQLLVGTGTYQTTTLPGQIHPLQNNPNTGLFNSAGSAFQGIFGSSK